MVRHKQMAKSNNKNICLSPLLERDQEQHEVEDEEWRGTTEETKGPSTSSSTEVDEEDDDEVRGGLGVLLRGQATDDPIGGRG